MLRLRPDLTRSRDKARPIFEEMRSQILAGRFSVGERLPGSRSLAEILGVARGTVNMALAMLSAEGLIAIAEGKPAQIVFKAAKSLDETKVPTTDFTKWARRLPKSPESSARAFFSTGTLADEFFPEREWLQAIRESRRQQGVLLSQVDQSTSGTLALRESIAAHLKYSRGLNARARNIVIVNGSMQAITLISQLLLEAGKSGAFENPGFHGIRSAVHATGAESVACAVDDEGMVLPRKKCELLFVTPASQFPTGAVMSFARRNALLDYARRQNAFIVEDEYDSEFTRFANAPQPLKLIDVDGRVIYVGSFSRTMFAALRIGYCVLPDSLIGEFLRARQLYDSVPPTLTDQLAMAAFMKSGAYRRHLRRMNKIYAERHDLLLNILQKCSPSFSVKPSAAGLNLFAYWRGSQSQFRLHEAAFKQLGIGWQNAERYYANKPERVALFGFSHLNAAQIAEAGARMLTI